MCAPEKGIHQTPVHEKPVEILDIKEDSYVPVMDVDKDKFSEHQEVSRSPLQKFHDSVQSDFTTTIPKETAAVTHPPQVKKVETKAERKAKKAELELEEEAQQKFLKGHKKATSKGKQGLLETEEEDRVFKLLSSDASMKKNKKGVSTLDEYQKIQQGDFSRFEKLPVPLRNLLATRHMKEVFAVKYQGKNFDEVVKDLKSQGSQGMLNPVLRLGISLGMRSGLGEFDKKFFHNLDNELCRQIMVNTLAQKYTHGSDDADVLRNAASQVHIAKNLFLAQMGSMQKITEKVIPSGKRHKKDTKIRSKGAWDTNVAAAFGHCSRVHYIMPPMQQQSDETKHKAMWDSFFKLKTRDKDVDGLDGSSGGRKLRGASTHDLQRRKVNGDTSAKELKRIIINPNTTGQYGMNVAVGGLNRTGVGGNVLKNDGTCGHLYSMHKDADVGVCGGYIVGFESDEYNKTNQLGHTHDMFATGEKSSSFGGQRTDEIGAKYGGREVDLSGFSPEEISENLDKIDLIMRVGLQEGSELEFDTGLSFNELLEKLTGPVMSKDEYKSFMTSINTLYDKLNK